MSIIPRAATVLTLLTVIALSVAAQNPNEDRVGAQPGYRSTFQVLYEFSGAQNDNNGAGDDIATSVHCTNRGSSSIDLIVEFFNTDLSGSFTSSTRVWD